jgi:hypothetical protein
MSNHGLACAAVALNPSAQEQRTPGTLIELSDLRVPLLAQA